MRGGILIIAIMILVTVLFIVIYFSLGIFRPSSTSAIEENTEEEIPLMPPALPE